MPDIPFHETEVFKRGQNGEQVVALMLKKKGWFVVPVHELTGEAKDKAPAMEGHRNRIVLPDLDVCRDGMRRWVEVKTKDKADYTRITKRLEHGIAQRLYEQYIEVQRLSGCEVWLAVYEETTGEVIARSLNKLEPYKRLDNGDKMERGGMIFFPRDQFHPLGQVETNVQ